MNIAHRVTIGTIMKAIRQAITTPIMIFSFMFLQYIILSNYVALSLN